MAKSQQAMGMECEKEHDWLTTTERMRLVQDHLKENPAYYSMLEEMEEDEDEDEDKDDELDDMSPKEYSEYRNKKETKKKGKR